MNKILVPIVIILGLTAVVAGIRLTGIAEQQLRNEAIAAGYTVIPGDPSIGEPDTFKVPRKDD